jgi:hypothetical protein
MVTNILEEHIAPLISVEVEMESVGFLETLLSTYETTKTKLNSVASVRERTIPTERPPLVGEVAAYFCG